MCLHLSAFPSLYSDTFTLRHDRFSVFDCALYLSEQDKKPTAMFFNQPQKKIMTTSRALGRIDFCFLKHINMSERSPLPHSYVFFFF